MSSVGVAHIGFLDCDLKFFGEPEAAASQQSRIKQETDSGLRVPTTVHSDLIFRKLTFSVQKGNKVAVVADGLQHSQHLFKAVRQDLTAIRGGQSIIGDILMQDQTLWFLPDTIQQNIIFGTEYQAKKYETILELVGLQQLILGMPGIQTVVISNNGYDLPADLQKLIVFARILYIDADIYLIDSFFDLLPQNFRASHLKAILEAFPQKTFLISTKEVDVLHCMDRALLLRGHELVRDDVLPIDPATFEEAYQPYLNELQIKTDIGSGLRKRLPETQPQEELKLPRLRTFSTSSQREAFTCNEYLTKMVTMKADYSLKSMYFHLVPDEKYIGRSFMIFKFFLFNSGWKLPALLLSMILINILTTYTFSWYVSSWRANHLNNLPIFTRLKFFSLISLGALITLAATAVTLIIQVRRSNQKLFTFMIKGLFAHGIEFFHKLSSAKIVNSIITEFMALDDVMGTNLQGLFVHFIRLHVVFIVSVYGTWFTALPIAVVYGFIVYSLLNTGYGIKSLANVVQANQLVLTQTIQNTYRLIPSIRDCRCVDYNIQKFKLVNQIYQNSKAHQNNLSERWLQARLHGYIMFLPILILLNGLFLRLFGYKADKWQGIKLTVALDLVFSIQGLVSASLARGVMLVSLEKIRELIVIDELTFKRKVQSKLPLLPLASQDSLLLEIRSLTVCNPITTLHILNRINLKVKKNSRLAFVGSRGSGKSTVFAVLHRLIDPSQILSGKVLFQGFDMKSVTDKAINTAIFRLSGKFKLYDGSLRDNIDPNTELTDEAILKVLDYLNFWSHFKRNKTVGGGGSHKISNTPEEEFESLFTLRSEKNLDSCQDKQTKIPKFDSQQYAAINKPRKNDYLNNLTKLATSSKNIDTGVPLRAKSFSNNHLEEISPEVGRFIELMPKSANKMFSLLNKENPELLSDVAKGKEKDHRPVHLLAEPPMDGLAEKWGPIQSGTGLGLRDDWDLMIEGCSVDERIGQKFSPELDIDDEENLPNRGSGLDLPCPPGRQPKKSSR